MYFVHELLHHRPNAVHVMRLRSTLFTSTRHLSIKPPLYPSSPSSPLSPSSPSSPLSPTSSTQSPCTTTSPYAPPKGPTSSPVSPWALPIPPKDAYQLKPFDVKSSSRLQQLKNAMQTLFRVDNTSSQPSSSTSEKQQTKNHLRRSPSLKILPSNSGTSTSQSTSIDQNWLSELRDREMNQPLKRNELTEDSNFQTALNHIYQQQQAARQEAVKAIQRNQDAAQEMQMRALEESKKKQSPFSPSSTQFPFVTTAALLMLGFIQLWVLLHLNDLKKCRTTQELQTAVDETIAFATLFQLNSTAARSGTSTPVGDVDARQPTPVDAPILHKLLHSSPLKYIAPSLYLRDELTIWSVKCICFALASTFLERMWGHLRLATFLLGSTLISNYVGSKLSTATQDAMEAVVIPFHSSSGGIAACVAAAAVFYPRRGIWRSLQISNRFLISPFLVFQLNGILEVANCFFSNTKKSLELKKERAEGGVEMERSRVEWRAERLCVYEEAVRLRILLGGCEAACEDAKNSDLYEPRKLAALRAVYQEKLQRLEKLIEDHGAPETQHFADVFSFSTMALVAASLVLKRKLF